MYAVNIADMTKTEIGGGFFVAGLLIAPVKGEVVQAERDNFDGAALTLNCDDERASAIVQVLRMKYKKHEVRCYQGSGKTWRRI